MPCVDIRYDVIGDGDRNQNLASAGSVRSHKLLGFPTAYLMDQHAGVLGFVFIVGGGLHVRILHH